MPGEPPVILLVDDDVAICENMTDILTDLGYQVDAAHDGRTALERIRERVYDVALLDLKMPGMDGLALYRELKKIRSGTVALLVTGYAGGSTSEEALAAGVWHVVPKPVDVPRLLGLVDEALGQPVVLVVDDDPDLCDNLWDLLRERGCRVCIAHDAQQAAERLRRSTQVVLIDLMLPDRDGAAVFRQVRQANPEARAVLMTGHRAEMEPVIERLRGEGVDAICYKPFDIPRFLETVGQLARG